MHLVTKSRALQRDAQGDPLVRLRRRVWLSKCTRSSSVRRSKKSLGTAVFRARHSHFTCCRLASVKRHLANWGSSACERYMTPTGTDFFARMYTGKLAPPRESHYSAHGYRHIEKKAKLRCFLFSTMRLHLAASKQCTPRKPAGERLGV